MARDDLVREIRALDPLDFERIMGNLWKERGYSVTHTSGSRDRGIDLYVSKPGYDAVVQVKRYSGSNKIGSSELRKYATLYIQEDIDEVIVVTSGFFTKPARNLADDLNVKILDIDDIIRLLGGTRALTSQSGSTDRSQTKSSNSKNPSAKTYNRSQTKTFNSENSSTKTYNSRNRPEEYVCPNCSEVMKRSGWFPYYHHFKDCRLPEEKPDQLSEDQWAKVKRRLERKEKDQAKPSTETEKEGDKLDSNRTDSGDDSRNKAEEYTCPNCQGVMKRTGWYPFYHHFKNCGLPGEKPDQLSDDQWRKVKRKLEQKEKDRIKASTKTEKEGDKLNSNRSDSGDDGRHRSEEYTCPNCQEVMRRTGWYPFYHHFKNCGLPKEKPNQLSDDQWAKVKRKLEEKDRVKTSTETEEEEGDKLDSNQSDSGDDSRSRAEEYTCPNCQEVMKRTGWYPFYHHFKNCELPEEKPGQLSVDQWAKVRVRFDRGENSGDKKSGQSDQIYTCPKCSQKMYSRSTDIHHHYLDCEIPGEKPAELREEKWQEILRIQGLSSNSKGTPTTSESSSDDGRTEGKSSDTGGILDPLRSLFR